MDFNTITIDISQFFLLDKTCKLKRNSKSRMLLKRLFRQYYFWAEQKLVTLKVAFSFCPSVTVSLWRGFKKSGWYGNILDHSRTIEGPL